MTYDINGLTDYTIIVSDSLTQSEVYNKTINWIKESYKNPDEVLVSNIKNQKIRFNGYSKTLYSYGGGLLKAGVFKEFRYTIVISFKDGKCKFDPSSLEVYLNPSKYSSGGWHSINLDDGKGYYKKNGEVRKLSINDISTYGYVFSKLSVDLNKYLKNEQDSNKDDTW